MAYNWFLILFSIPKLLSDAGMLEHDGEALLKDPALKAEIASNPLIGGEFAKISAEWRSVENDEIKISKSNFFTFFPATAQFLRDAGVLVGTVEGDVKNFSIQAALDKMPLTKAAIARISAEWRAVEEDLAAVGVHP